MLKLLDTTSVPPGGFRYLCPETSTWVQAPSFMELISAASRHRAANKLGIPEGFREQVESQLCSTMPPGVCRHESGVAHSGQRRLSISDVISATKTLGQWFLKGTPKVSQAEADRRATICLSCPMNQQFDGCNTCAEKDIRNAIVSFMGDSTTPYDAQLATCFTCGCTLKAAVWFPLDLLQKNMPDNVKSDLPDHCWKK